MSNHPWYYGQDNRAVGPVTEEALRTLLTNGTLPTDTLVWNEEMTDWCKASYLSRFQPATPPPLPQIPPPIPVIAPPIPVILRPAAVTTFGILNIIFGSMGVLLMPLMFLAVKEIFLTAPAWARLWILSSILVDLLTTSILVALGMGLLKLMSWARSGCIAYAWFIFLWTILDVGMAILMIATGIHSPVYNSEAGLVAGIGSALVGGMLELLYPLCLILYMRMPNIIRAFHK